MSNMFLKCELWESLHCHHKRKTCLLSEKLALFLKMMVVGALTLTNGQLNYWSTPGCFLLQQKHGHSWVKNNFFILQKCLLKQTVSCTQITLLHFLLCSHSLYSLLLAPFVFLSCRASPSTTQLCRKVLVIWAKCGRTLGLNPLPFPSSFPRLLTPGRISDPYHIATTPVMTPKKIIENNGPF